MSRYGPKNHGYKVAIFHDVIPIRFPQITWLDSKAGIPLRNHRYRLRPSASGLKASEVDLLATEVAPN